MFNEFNRVFTDKLFSADFSVYTIEKLANIRSEAENALNGISVYDENIISTLLGQNAEKAKTIVPKCDEFMVSNFTAMINSLVKDFDGESPNIKEFVKGAMR